MMLARHRILELMEAHRTRAFRPVLVALTLSISENTARRQLLDLLAEGLVDNVGPSHRKMYRRSDKPRTSRDILLPPKE